MRRSLVLTLALVGACSSAPPASRPQEEPRHPTLIAGTSVWSGDEDAPDLRVVTLPRGTRAFVDDRAVFHPYFTYPTAAAVVEALGAGAARECVALGDAADRLIAPLASRSDVVHAIDLAPRENVELVELPGLAVLAPVGFVASRSLDDLVAPIPTIPPEELYATSVPLLVGGMDAADAVEMIELRLRDRATTSTVPPTGRLVTIYANEAPASDLLAFVAWRAGVALVRSADGSFVASATSPAEPFTLAARDAEPHALFELIGRAAHVTVRVEHAGNEPITLLASGRDPRRLLSVVARTLGYSERASEDGTVVLDGTSARVVPHPDPAPRAEVDPAPARAQFVRALEDLAFIDPDRHPREDLDRRGRALRDATRVLTRVAPGEPDSIVLEWIGRFVAPDLGDFVRRFVFVVESDAILERARASTCSRDDVALSHALGILDARVEDARTWDESPRSLERVVREVARIRGEARAISDLDVRLVALWNAPEGSSGVVVATPGGSTTLATGETRAVPPDGRALELVSLGRGSSATFRSGEATFSLALPGR